MITAFGHFDEEAPLDACNNVTFAGNFSGGTAKYRKCGDPTIYTINVTGGTTTKSLCIVTDSIVVTGDVTSSIGSTCTSNGGGIPLI